MRKAIEADLCVNEQQRFSTGFSYGGGMSYSIACSRGKEFRAVAVISGAQLSGCSGGSDPVAYLGIHGINDGVLNISTGRSLRDRFVKNNGCTNQSPREPAKGSKSHVKTSYSGCRAGYPVTWIAFDGGHGPGPVDGSTSDSGVRSYVPDEIWSFFNQFN
jgi:poly(3-hydroxybutyrate) depolymerase